ncbi:Vps5-domain-containing protein [Phanerochaete sordida]|uniref:Vps5-domain-containing protein n=1 Tax=Phanerochaete sordida TaxID=48140 RepID=A0A9P3GA87_9APHY|nr:Vps5-domain-containing protein [Phanerochaete sordida]
MANFDDLLAPTRDALERNPFADPFGRPSSPDPWTSFQTPASSTIPTDDPGDPFGAEFRSTTPTADEPDLAGGAAASSDTGFAAYDHSEDPLEASKAFDSEESVDTIAHEQEPPTPTEQAPLASPKSPGFRESVSTTIDDVLTPAPPPVERKEPTPPPAPSLPPPLVENPPLTPASPPPTSPVDSASLIGHAPSSSAASIVSPSATPLLNAPSKNFYSPLDQPQSLERSFSGLAIGGESVNGWQSMAQGSQSMFVGTASRPSAQDEEDEDDDKPILQARMNSLERAQRAGSPAIPPSPPPLKRNDPGIAPVFTISVDDPQRVGDPIRGYTMYTVHTKTNSPMYSKSAFSVLRRYSDFLWLYETLSNNNPGVVVPPVPEKSPFNRFDTQFVQQRRLALEKCISKIANHPVLQKDPDLKLFLESDTFSLDIKHRKAEIAHEKGGVLASLGQSITGPRFHETDEWFDKQKGYLDSLEVQLRGLVKSIDLVAKQRADLAAAAGEFAQTIQDLASSDVGLGQQLAGALAGLAVVERKAQDLQEKQANEDTLTIMSTADEYARLINSVRLAFSSRIRMYYGWQMADRHVRTVKQQHEANRAQGKLNSDQLSRSLALVAEAERRALEAKQEFDQCSRLVKSEMARFEQERIEDFKNSLEAFLSGMISKQKELIVAWETYQQTLLRKSAPPAQRQVTVDAVSE